MLKNTRFAFRSLLILVFTGTNAFAAGDDVFVQVPFDQHMRPPAVDLRYQGTLIGHDQATDLRRRGVDLSLLDPEMNDLWQPNPLPMSAKPAEFPAEGTKLQFGSLRESSNFYRAQVSDPQGRSYFLIIDLNNHRSLVTAALMRKLGYQVPAPMHYRQLKLTFANRAEYDDFMGRKPDPSSDDPGVVGDVLATTGTKVSSWVTRADPEKLEVTLQDVNLEVARITVPQYYQGSILPTWIQGRRSARAAIVPLSLLNFNLSYDSINIFSAETGRIENDALLLEHPNADVFFGTGMDDVHWILRKIAMYTREDWKQILMTAKFPEDITAVLLEKVISRRDYLVSRAKLADSLPNQQRRLRANLNISIGSVKDGEVTKERYDGYAARFTVGDPDSPLRWQEIKHYLNLEVAAQAIAAAATKLNMELQFGSAKDALFNHIKDVYRKAIEWQIRNPGQPYAVPVKGWAEKMYGVNVNATRSVVTGTYYGSDSKVQLVDNVSIGGTAGLLAGLDGKKWAYDQDTFTYKLMGMANVGYMRNYTHVRPLPSLEASKKESWANLAVPLFMRSLGKLVDPKLLNQGDQEVKRALKEFLSDLREGEVFTITDTYAFRAGPTYTIPLTALIGPGLKSIGLSVGVGVTGEYAILKRVMITRRNGNIEIYDNKMNTRGIGANVDLNAWINIARATWQKKAGHAKTDAMLLDLTPVEEDDLLEEGDEGTGDAQAGQDSQNQEPLDLEKIARERRRLLKTLNVVFRHNEVDSLKEYYPAHHLEHDMKSRLTNGKVALWSWNSFKSTHQVRITPPKDKAHDFDPKDHARTLYQVRRVDLHGKDPYGFLGQVAGKAIAKLSDEKVQGTFSGNSGNLNPSGVFMGKANWTTVQSEAEITSNESYAPMVTVEDHYAGWNLKKENLLEIMDAIDQGVKVFGQSTPIFSREVFNSTKKLQAYEIRSTVLIFPEGVIRLEDMLFRARSRQERLIRLMDMSEKPELRKSCRKYLERNDLEAKLQQIEALPEEVMEDSKLWHRCVEPWMRRVMRWARKAPKRSDKENYLQWMNRTVHLIQKKASLPRLLKRIGTDQFFFTVRVNGFRTKDENGDQTYIASTIGSIPPDAKRSPFNGLTVYSNGKAWTLSEYETNAQYFGSGL